MATAASEKLNTKVVSQADWLAARKELLAKEKEFTRLRDELSRQRRELPWEKVEKQYVFEGPNGQRDAGRAVRRTQPADCVSLHVRSGMEGGLPELLVPRRQLRRNADPPGATRCGVRGGFARNPAGNRGLQEAHGMALSVGVVERKRLQLRLSGVVHEGPDGDGEASYNFGTMDFPSEEGPGLSVFYKDEKGEIFHTYSTYARGLDILLTTYNFLDMTPKGRDEEGMMPHAMAWVRHHDRYAGGEAAGCCSGEAAKASTMLEPMLGEFQEEAAVTRRILERVPADKLTWKPHPKSMSLGQLAIHIATVPGATGDAGARGWASMSRRPISQPPQPKDVQEIQAAFEASVSRRRGAV